MKVVRIIVSTILSFLIIFAAFLLIGFNILDGKLLKKEYMLAKLDEVDFYTQISREIESGFEKYIYQSGLPEETIKNLFTEDILKNDVNSLVNCLYDGTEIELSDETIRSTLNTRVQEFLESQDKKIDKNTQNNIKKFEDLIVKEYKENVNVSTTLYKQGHDILEIGIGIRNKIVNWPPKIIIILVIALILINIKNLLGAINFLGISALSCGILLKLGVNLIFTNIDFDNLLIFAQSISSVIASIAKENLYMIAENGNFLIVCGITAILASAIVGKYRKILKPKRRVVKWEKYEKEN